MELICDNGGWCWYQDPRMIVDRDTGKVLLASIASSGGIGGKTRSCDAQVSMFDPATGESSTVVIGGKLNSVTDDHNVPALWQRPDGRFLVMHTGHNFGRKDKRPQSFYRISTEPNNASNWSPELAFDWPTDDPVGNGSIAVTYSNLHFLADENDGRGRLYNIGRSSGQTWQIATSDDWGETWTHRGILSLPPEGGRAYSNGYPKFCDNGKNRIDFIITEAHPRDYNNGIYHGYIRDGKSYDAAGSVVDPDTFSNAAPRPEEFTTLFSPGEPEGDNRHTAWTVALARDMRGDLFALYTARIGTRSIRAVDSSINPIGDAHHCLFYAKLVGDTWQAHEVCPMGRGLYKPESDYTGLAAVDARDGGTIYVSTNHDPATGTRIPQRDLFQGVTPDGGASWTWTRLTEETVEDYVRPIAVELPDGRLMLGALHGDYFTMHDYNQRVVGRVLD